MRGPERVLATADAVGGVWTYAVALGRELAAHGVRTTLAVMGPSPQPAQRAEAAAAGLDVVDRPYRLEWMDDPWDDVDRAGEWLLDVEASVGPSLVHLNGYAHAVLPWRSPVMVVAHSCVRTWWRAVRKEAPPPSIDRYRDAVHAGLSSAHLVAAPTAAMGRALEEEYGVPPQVRTVPNGLRRHAPSMSAAKEEIVFTAGRVWDEAKNVAAVCAVAPALAWPVCVAGPRRGPDDAGCALPSVHALGQLTAAEMQAWYARSSIYVLPARYEPFGLSVLEAAAAGCALVLGDIPSLRENWDGAAIFVDPDDHAMLAGAIQRLIAMPSERTALAREAQTRATTFTIARTAEHYLHCYQSL